jgi:hypothetical protein
MIKHRARIPVSLVGLALVLALGIIRTAWTSHAGSQENLPPQGIGSNPAGATAPATTAPTLDRAPAVTITHFLPMVARGWPPVPQPPVLNPIPQPGSEGNYVVTWQGQGLAASYSLQEASSADFADATPIYQGPERQYAIDGQPIGTYYYRVKAINVNGESDWSNVEEVTVPPPPTAPTLSELVVQIYYSPYSCATYEYTVDVWFDFSDPNGDIRHAATVLAVFYPSNETFLLEDIDAWQVEGDAFQGRLALERMCATFDPPDIYARLSFWIYDQTGLKSNVLNSIMYDPGDPTGQGLSSENGPRFGRDRRPD